MKFKDFLLEINLSEGEDILEKKFEILTTAKQTDSRYGDFSFSKEKLTEIAKNFNQGIVGTEIPVDLNHDPEHIAYAWIKPKSMEVSESTKIDGEYSLFCNLYRFTPEGENLIKTGKVRYFSLQIQNKFEKFVDGTKKVFNNVVRALALTNMPVIKDMSPTLSEPNLFNNPNYMENEALEKRLSEMQESLDKKMSEVQKELSEKDKILSEKEAENKKLSEKLEKVEAEKREIKLSEQLDSLMLSEDKKVGFKGGEKDKVLEFVKTLSEEQSDQYFAIHKDILTKVDLSEKGDDKGGEAVKTKEEADKKLGELAQTKAKKESIDLAEAQEQVINENPELSKIAGVL